MTFQSALLVFAVTIISSFGITFQHYPEWGMTQCVIIIFRPFLAHQPVASIFGPTKGVTRIAPPSTLTTR